MPQHGSFEYGGIKFTRLVSPDEISAYVGNLSPDRSKDIESIVMALESAGLLTIEQTEEKPERADGDDGRPDAAQNAATRGYGTASQMAQALRVDASLIMSRSDEGNESRE